MSELWFAWLWQSAGSKWSCLPIVVTLVSYLSAFSPTSSTLCPFSCPSLYRFLFPLLSPVSSFDFLRAPSFPCYPSPYYSSSFPSPSSFAHFSPSSIPFIIFSPPLQLITPCLLPPSFTFTSLPSSFYSQGAILLLLLLSSRGRILFIFLLLQLCLYPLCYPWFPLSFSLPPYLPLPPPFFHPPSPPPVSLPQRLT